MEALRRVPLDPPPRYDAVFFEGMATLDSEEEATMLLEGPVTIPPDVLQALLDQEE